MGDQFIGNLNTALVGNEKTGSTAQVMSGVKDIGHNVVSQFNPMGGMINTGAKTIGNLIGGTKDRVEGTGSQIQGMVSDGLSMLQNYFNLVKKPKKYWAFFTSSQFEMGLLWNLGCIHIFQDTSFSILKFSVISMVLIIFWIWQ